MQKLLLAAAMAVKPNYQAQPDNGAHYQCDYYPWVRKFRIGCPVPDAYEGYGVVQYVGANRDHKAASPVVQPSKHYSGWQGKDTLRGISVKK